MDNFFGGKDPFDHPFFTQPFGSLFGGRRLFDDSFFTGKFDDHSGPRKQIRIEELNPDDDGGNGFLQKNTADKKLSVDNFDKYPTGTQTFSFQRVAYGGRDGVYYSSSLGRRTGSDGVFMMEVKEDDQTIGGSLHTVSRGIHDKGHSVTTRNCSDGRVDSLQTLHNLEEDELSGFEEKWRTNAEKVLPGWSNDFSLLEYAGAGNNTLDSFTNWGGWPFPSLEYFGDGRAQPYGGGTQEVSSWSFPSVEYFGSGGTEADGETQNAPRRRRRIVPVE